MIVIVIQLILRGILSTPYRSIYLSIVIIFDVLKLWKWDLILLSVMSVHSWPHLNADLRLKLVLNVWLMFRSSSRGWRWSSARWPETRRSCRGTSWSSPSTPTCWRSHGPSCTAAPEWVCFCSFDTHRLSVIYCPPPSHTLLCISGEMLPLTSPAASCFSRHWRVLSPRVTEVELALTLINGHSAAVTSSTQLLRAVKKRNAAKSNSGVSMWDRHLWE